MVSSINKAKLSGINIITQFILPAIKYAGWLVTKVKELLGIWVHLKARFNASQANQFKLTYAIVEQAV